MRELSDMAFIAGRVADNHAAMLISEISRMPFIIPLSVIVCFFSFCVCALRPGRSVPFLVRLLREGYFPTVIYDASASEAFFLMDESLVKIFAALLIGCTEIKVSVSAGK